MNYLKDRLEGYTANQLFFGITLSALILCFLLQRSLPIANTIAVPIAIIWMCSAIWLFVTPMNNVRKTIGSCLIVLVLFRVLFKSLPSAEGITFWIMVPILALSLLEFTQVARKNLRISILWALFIPLLLMAFDRFVAEDYRWVVDLGAYPIAWILMSLFADTDIYRKVLKWLFFGTSGLLALIYITTDIVSLSVVTQFIKNQAMTQLFSDNRVLPGIHLIMTAVFLPMLLSCGVIHVILNKRSQAAQYLADTNN